MTAVVQDIAPNDSSSLFQEACSSSALRETLSTLSKDSDEETIVNETLMSALAECYYAATYWETRRQILSVMADKVPSKRLLKWIPDLTKYRYTEAKRHCFLHGRGAPVKSDPTPRKRVSTAKNDHFITFITGSHILQDLPIGERTITLSTKETIKVPNLIRTLLPERIVKQYRSYCKESGFEALGRSTLPLKKCATSMRKHARRR